MKRARRGMTLIELVIGIAITGMMAAAGVSAFTTIIDQRRAIREGTAAMERAAALREMIHSWLVSGTVQIQQGGGPRGLGGGRATPAPAATPNSAIMNNNANTGVTAAAQNGDEVTFVTTAPNPAMSPSARIRLFIDTDLSTPERGLTIEYQATAPVGVTTPIQPPLQRRQLDNTIGGMTVEFLDSKTNRWYDATQASTIQPVAVRISLQAADGMAIPGILQLPLIFPMGTRAQ